MNCYVFAYGTLLDEEIRNYILGYKTTVLRAQLKGFRKSSILLAGVKYPAIKEDPDNNQTVDGAYFSINEKDLELIDQYESSAYSRIRVRLENGIQAWTYCCK